MTRKPDFFLAGAPRCGTTAMFSYLGKHPEVFIPEVKEPSFFGSDLHHVDKRDRDRAPSVRPQTLEQYFALFAEGKQKKIAGECSVFYFFSKRAAREIKEFNPSARVIIMLRDPVEMMYSWHKMMLFIGHERIADFDAALNAEDRRKRGEGLPSPPYCLEALFYREMAKLARNVARYLKVFDRDSIHFIIFDDFERDAARVYRETLRFLGVNSDFAPDFKAVNANRAVRSRFWTDFLKNPPPAARRLVNTFVGPSMTRKLKRFLWDAAAPEKPRPPMDPGLRKRLQAEFLPEVEQLSELLGRDLTHWCKREDAEPAKHAVASTAISSIVVV